MPRSTERDLLTHLIELLADKDKMVRVEIVRAIEQIGSVSCAVAASASRLGSDEPEVLGACYGGILRIDGVRAIPWVSRFLAAADDNAAEAALAIAGTHSLEGFDVLREVFDRAHDPWWRSVLLSAIALTRQEAALEFLLECVRKESLNAEPAIEAILRSMPSPDVVRRLEKLVGSNPRLKRAFVAQERET